MMFRFIAWLKRVFDITDTVVTKVELYEPSCQGCKVWLQLKSGLVVLDEKMSDELGIEPGDEILIVVRKGAGR